MAPSQCEGCGHKLGVLDLIPVLSYLMTQGKCRYCKAHVSWVYPMSEFMLGLMFLLSYLEGMPLYFYVVAIVVFIFAAFDYIDMGFPKWLTHVLMLFLAVVAFIARIGFDAETLQASSMAFSLGLLFVFMIINLWKPAIGMGDLLIIFGLSMLFSLPELLIFFQATFVLGAIYAVGLILLRGGKVQGTKVPLVPFMFLALFAVIYLTPSAVNFVNDLMYLIHAVNMMYL